VRWHKDPRRDSGGSWRCRIKGYEYDRRWREAHPKKVQDRNWESNERRLFAGGIYCGMVGFTGAERAARLSRGPG
jgi:hypothetical protein